jgi:hypothetical protein
LNYIRLCACLIVFTSAIYSSFKSVQYVESYSGASTQYSFVRRFTAEDNIKKDKDMPQLTSQKQELIRLWLESTANATN